MITRNDVVRATKEFNGEYSVLPCYLWTDAQGKACRDANISVDLVDGLFIAFDRSTNAQVKHP